MRLFPNFSQTQDKKLQKQWRHRENQYPKRRAKRQRRRRARAIMGRETIRGTIRPAMAPLAVRRLCLYHLRAPSPNAKQKMRLKLRKRPPPAPNQGKGTRRESEEERKRSERKRTWRCTSFPWTGLGGLLEAKIPICVSAPKPFSLSTKLQYFFCLFLFLFFLILF